MRERFPQLAFQCSLKMFKVKKIVKKISTLLSPLLEASRQEVGFSAASFASYQRPPSLKAGKEKKANNLTLFNTFPHFAILYNTFSSQDTVLEDWHQNWNGSQVLSNSTVIILCLATPCNQMVSVRKWGEEGDLERLIRKGPLERFTNSELRKDVMIDLVARSWQVWLVE